MSREFPHTVKIWEATQTEDSSGGYEESKGTKRYEGSADVQDASATLGEALAELAGGGGSERSATRSVYLPDSATVAEVGVAAGDYFEWTGPGITGRVSEINRTEDYFKVAS